jgi:hypothetical protein
LVIFTLRLILVKLFLNLCEGGQTGANMM